MNGDATQPASVTTVSGSDRGRSPRRVRTLIWSLNAGLAVAATALGIVVAGFGRAGDLTRSSAFWILVALFAAFEILVVHVRFRDDAHTFSMAEAAIALGLLTATPAQLLLAQAVGGGLVLAIHRRQPLIKLAFNLCQQGLGTAAAICVVHVVLGDGDSLGPRSWLAVGLAVAASSMVGTGSILVVLRLATGSVSVRSHFGTTVFGLVNSLLSASLGLVAVVVLSARSNATILLAIPAASVFATNLAYVSQRDKHQRLEFLYGTTRALAASQELEDGLTQLLEQTRDALGCDLASLMYRPLDSADHVLVTTVLTDGGIGVMTSLSRAELGEEWWALLESQSPRLDAPDDVPRTSAGREPSRPARRRDPAGRSAAHGPNPALGQPALPERQADGRDARLPPLRDRRERPARAIARPAPRTRGGALVPRIARFAHRPRQPVALHRTRRHRLRARPQSGRRDVHRPRRFQSGERHARSRRRRRPTEGDR